MTDVSVTRSGTKYPVAWAIFSLIAAVGFMSRVVRSIMTGELQAPIMSTIKLADSPYLFYGVLTAVALFAGLCALGSFSYWQEWKKKRAR